MCKAAVIAKNNIDTFKQRLVENLVNFRGKLMHWFHEFFRHKFPMKIACLYPFW